MSDYKPDAKDVMKLRQETDAPVNECRQALMIGNGDPEALRQVAIQVVAHPPEVVSKDQLSQEFLNKEIEIETKRALDEGKPENIAKNIAQGRVNKETIKRVVLTEQGFYKDP